MKKNVILSICSDYSYYELQPFAESWKENANDVDWYLFYFDLSEWTKNCLKKMGVNLLEVPNDYKEEIKNDFSKISIIRMRMANDFLKKNISEYKYALLLDVRDVVIQANPFSYVPRDEYLLFSCEGVAIGSNPVNANWTTQLLGNEKWKSQFGSREIINGGVYGGTVNEIIKFHEKMLNIVSQKFFFGWDQASMGYLVYTGSLEAKNIICSNPNSTELVSIALQNSEFKIKNGCIENRLGKAPNVVHQYDRSSYLVDFVNSRYRKSNYEDVESHTDLRSVLELIRAYTLRKMYKKALKASLLFVNSGLDKRYMSLINSIINDIIVVCNKHKDDAVVSLIGQMVSNHAVDAFSNTPVAERGLYLDSYLSLVMQNCFVCQASVDRFTSCLWELLNYHVDKKDFVSAHRLVQTTGCMLRRSVGADFYFLAADVSRQLNYVDESVRYYAIACKLKCYPISYLKSHFNSCVFIKDNFLKQVRTLNPNDKFMLEEMMDLHPLLYMEKEDGCVLFIFKHGQFKYLQSIKEKGFVDLGDKPKIFKNSVNGVDKVSIKANETAFLSTGPNGTFGFAEWAYAWEQFRLIHCYETELYSVISDETNL